MTLPGGGGDDEPQAVATKMATPSPSTEASLALSPETRRSRTRRKRLSEDEEDELWGAFDVFDSQKLGYVKYRETKALMRALGFQVNKQEVRDLFRLYERDVETEGLEFFEFREIMMDKVLERDPWEEHRKVFRLFDKDGSGKISLRDMRLLARQIGEKVTDETLLDMIDEFDLDGDGEIDMEEFLQIMANDDVEV